MQPNHPYLINQFPKNPLTPGEEAVLFHKFKQGNESALTDLVMANMREALLYTQRVSYGRIDDPTRVSLCYQEMCMSARRFNPGKLRYFAFAKAGLRGRMKTYWTSLNTVRHAKGLVSVESMISGIWDRSPKCAFSTVAGGIRGATTVPMYIGPTKRDREPEDDKEMSYRESVTGEVEFPDPESMLAKDHWNVIREKLADRLSEQQWMILDLTYKGGLNFPQIAKLLGLTRSAIHASHRKAILKLRDGVKEEKGLLLC